ncbi:hypothetical protein A2853_03560 [Candidatus Kaiserbacteria bacterium RIFCSPHIGHO2_01_FULL_55_17]|uniref:Uncharacterized protein n=1 Tax=Candidatus Kaiserbacteria bacterium RIFCSPHIGHO2_01_FULL_55_17 TaxID=1798484 RepID=A0A1F6D951_9BACT|nr:MAG: hypothetical protein A2853_03560 [Candidatus Kaiserbacteria bacterium RIFCSPHIGHO2_01_FULL_55_17]
MVALTEELQKELEQAVRMQLDLESRAQARPDPVLQNQTGPSGWLVAKGFVTLQSGTNISLISIIVLCLVVTGLIYVWGMAPTPYTLQYASPETPQIPLGNSL